MDEPTRKRHRLLRHRAKKRCRHARQFVHLDQTQFPLLNPSGPIAHSLSKRRNDLPALYAHIVQSPDAAIEKFQTITLPVFPTPSIPALNQRQKTYPSKENVKEPRAMSKTPFARIKSSLPIIDIHRNRRRRIQATKKNLSDSLSSKEVQRAFLTFKKTLTLQPMYACFSKPLWVCLISSTSFSP